MRTFHPSKLLSIAFLFFVTSQALAATNSGLDTPQGVTSLPLSVQGSEGIDLVQQSSGSVYVGVGTSAPQAPLDVNGGVHATNADIIANTSCSSVPEGTIAYDKTNHEPVYCSQAGSWESMSSNIVFGGMYTQNTCGAYQQMNPYTGSASCPSWASVSHTGGVGVTYNGGWSGCLFYYCANK